LARPAGFEPATRCLEGRFAQRVSLLVGLHYQLGNWADRGK
jgi:hypothetical protein